MEIVRLVSGSICAVIFIGVAVIHYYWVFGGKLGIDVALPELEQTREKAFVPGKFATFVVATLFLSIGIIYFIIGFKVESFFLVYKLYFLYALSAITFIRAVGDFKYVGFFKKVKHSKFAEYDTKYFSPLCLAIAFITVFQLLL